MRSFTANFKAQAASKTAKPYQILEIDFGGTIGTKYFLDRASTAFDTADNSRVPASGIGNSLVIQWPSVSLSLKEGQIGATDQCSVVLNDAAGEITGFLNSGEMQRKLVTVWRLFDDASTVWPTDAGQIFTGILLPFSWTAQDNQISLNLGDLGPLLAKDISCIASSSIFTKLPPASQDKNIPLCWGRAQRVEALPVSFPWETKIAQPTTGANPETVQIVDDLSLLPGVVAETAYAAVIGTNNVTATFHQAADPTSELSTVTISAPGPPLLAWLGGILRQGTLNLLVPTGQAQIHPGQYDLSLNTILANGMTPTCVINKAGNPDTVTGPTLSGITLLGPDDSAEIPGSDAICGVPTWKLVFTDDTAGDLANASTNGFWVTFYFYGTSSNPSAWPAGTIIRAADQTCIYAISALPSKAVQIVEGFGTIADSSGSNRKDFVVLGEVANTFLTGSTYSTVLSSLFTINLNDSTWNAAGLERNLTTITFKQQPRDLAQNLDDNRIWCTVLGVEDAGNGTGNPITNPALVILQYLENADLMNVSSADIDVTSFNNAATALIGYIVGFPQIETRPGLQLLQEIATQCSSVLIFDQGKAKMVVLGDTPGTLVATFDTTTHDNMLQGSLQHSESAVADLINENVIKWTPYWDGITGNKPQDVRNYLQSSILAFGRIATSFPDPCYLYWRRLDVESQRDWWLNHKGSIFRYVKFTGFLDALILQPGDWISVTWIDGAGRNLFGGAKSMQVTKTTDTGKDGLVEIEARYLEYTFT